MLVTKAREARTTAQQDPVLWVKTVLGVEPWAMQQRVLESVRDNRETVVRSCHSMGKSFVAACVVIWFLYTHPSSIVITTAPTDRQVRGILWREIRRMHRRAPHPLGGEPLTKQLSLRDDWYAWGFTAPEWDPTRFQGFHGKSALVVIDEASGVSPLIYEAIDSILSGQHARMLHIGNPTDETGRFGQAFKTGHASRITVSAFDTPNLTGFGITIDDIRSGKWRAKANGPYPFPTLVTPDWVADMHERWGENSPMWEARVLARFPVLSDNALVPWPWIERSTSAWNELGGGGLGVTATRLGVDVARLGDDTTVIAPSARTDAGELVLPLLRAPKQDTMATVGWVVNTAKAHGVDGRDVRVDGDGLGAGVVDRLRELGLDVIEMRGGMRPHEPERFVNRRAEWMWTLRERLDPQRAGDADYIMLPPDPALHEQLASIRWKLDSRGRIGIESKDDMRRRGMKSPDEADAVAYATAQNVGGFDVAGHFEALARW